ncbi:MAG: hypothetical protein O3A14_19370 [Cyanobacteria bacterium]|nr:hypothetical protein [Cyanobacteriota bacterium]
MKPICLNWHRIAPLALASALTLGISAAHATSPVVSSDEQVETTITTSKGSRSQDGGGWGCPWATEPLPGEASELSSSTNWWWCWPW